MFKNILKEDLQINGLENLSLLKKLLNGKYLFRFCQSTRKTTI